MNFLSKLERKCEWLNFQNLYQYMIVIYLVGLIIKLYNPRYYLFYLSSIFEIKIDNSAEIDTTVEIDDIDETGKTAEISRDDADENAEEALEEKLCNIIFSYLTASRNIFKV